MTRRVLMGALVLGAVGLPLSVPALSTPAAAAGPTSVTITGVGLSTPLEVRADADPELFAAVLSQVSFMAAGPAQTHAPSVKRLGQKYTIVVFVKDKARQKYDLYPLARGGPRAFRPAKQPDLRKTTNAWFFGRLNMSETLRIAGVPLPIRADALSGGVGGGIGGVEEDPKEDVAYTPADDLTAVIVQWRLLFLLNGAVVLLIAAGLAGFSLLIRPKT
jgi:hypothetical protein